MRERVWGRQAHYGMWQEHLTSQLRLRVPLATLSDEGLLINTGRRLADKKKVWGGGGVWRIEGPRSQGSYAATFSVVSMAMEQQSIEHGLETL